MDLICQWLSSNLDIIFFIYGLAFVIMGITVLLQPKIETEFKLVHILWLLAAFGITHGINEFLDMWGIIKGRNPVLDVVRWFILTISFILLFEFGRQLFRINCHKYPTWLKNLAKLLVCWIWPLAVISISVFGLLSPDFWTIGSILSRYILGFPGGCLTSAGFVLYLKYEKEKLQPLKVNKYFFQAASLFLVYGVLSGLVVPKGNFFPANWLNTDSFFLRVKIPVQVFRAICAVGSSVAVVGMLGIFRTQLKEQLERDIGEWKQAKEQLKESEQRFETIFEGMTDGILLVDIESKKFYIGNKMICQMLGYSIEEIKNLRVMDIHPKEELPYVLKQFERQAKNMIELAKDIPVKRKDGSIFYSDVNSATITLAGKTYLLGIFRDITERKKMEEQREDLIKELKQNQELLNKQNQELDDARRAIKNVAKDLMVAKQALEQQKGALESINRELDDFTYIVSHDLKEPLRSIDAFSKFVVDDYREKLGEEGFNYLERIRINAGRMQSLIEDLLEISRIERKKYPFVEIKAEELIREVSQRLEYAIKQKNAQLVVADNLPVIFCDRVRLTEVFINLVSNAVKFADKPAPLIEIGCRDKNPFYEFYIKDNGPGIEERYFNKVFEIFQRLGKREDHEGTGAGLTIAKKVVEMHKGRIWLESKVGEGTTFYFTISQRKELIIGRKKIGEMLVEKKLVTEEEVKQALNEQHKMI